MSQSFVQDQQSPYVTKKRLHTLEATHAEQRDKEKDWLKRKSRAERKLEWRKKVMAKRKLRWKRAT